MKEVWFWIDVLVLDVGNRLAHTVGSDCEPHGVIPTYSQIASPYHRSACTCKLIGF